MKRKTIIIVSVIAVCSAAAIFVLPRISFYMLTGRFFPVSETETLQNPVGVIGWNTNSLRLSDGRIIQIPGLRSLPTESPALTETTKRGVEIETNGQVLCLIQIHHWCGNDPVKNHVAKVNLSDLMVFLKVGEPTGPVPEKDSLVRTPGGNFSEWGWRIEEFLQFQTWQAMKNSKP